MNRPLPAAGAPPLRYWFAGFRLEADGTLLRGETALDLPTEEAAVLRLLLVRAGEIVSPIELKRAVWGEEHASCEVVARCVASLRERLQPADCIESVYKRGYRFSVAVHTDETRSTGALPRLAILPFEIGYGVPEYLGSAIAEAAMEQLSGAEYAVASVVARESVFTLARRGMTPHKIGKVLDADLVLGGELHATPERLRLRAEMIRVTDGAQLWIEDVMVERGRIMELERELVNRVSSRIHSGSFSIAATATADLAREASPQHSEAHELYLRAHHEWQSLERHRMQDAMGRLQRAIDLDPSYIAARADLAHLCVSQAFCGFMSPTAAASVVRRAAAQIPESAGNAETLLPAMGWIRFHVDRNLHAALDAFARSEHLPHDHLPHDRGITRLRTMFLLSRHRFDEALDVLRTAILADPYSPWLQARLAWALHLAGEAEASVDQIRKAISQFTEHSGAHLYGAMILAYNGEAARAVELARALAARSPHFDLATSVHAYALACAGRKEEARTLLERLQWLSRERFVMNTFDAATYVAMDEDDAALEELRIANENRCPWFFQMLADPRLQPLRGRPEFERMRSTLRAMEADAEKGEEAGWAAVRAG
ncbi:MAG: winged helix-turn-helix domain-containing protein [Terracidiphilus sp.]|jgi:DNA-binding winged helix-turn-helix (wHTH) protein/tetratricopeptide (TPR) repeat protein